MVVVHADYQFELELLNFTNPTGRVAGGDCCEPEAENPNTGLCIPEDTCDTRIKLRLQNFDYLRDIGTPTNYVLGTFDNTNSITFPICETIVSAGSNAAMNPLIFNFPTTDFGQYVS